MKVLGNILWATFLADLGVMLTVRGVQFYAVYGLSLTEPADLALSLAFGVVYVLGALLSHHLARTLGEKRLPQVPLLFQVAAASGLATSRSVPIGIFSANAALGLANGLLWPVIEGGLKTTYCTRGTGACVCGCIRCLCIGPAQDQTMTQPYPHQSQTTSHG